MMIDAPLRTKDAELDPAVDWLLGVLSAGLGRALTELY